MSKNMEFPCTFGDSGDKAHGKRQRMCPWLEEWINSGKIKGLQWVDKHAKIFRVPWKRVANKEWCESDAQIFKEWAVYTGRHAEGQQDPDWPTWKTRFRTAMTKLGGINELRELNNLNAQTDEPYRVYQFVSSSNNTPTTVKQFNHRKVNPHTTNTQRKVSHPAPVHSADNSKAVKHSNQREARHHTTNSQRKMSQTAPVYSTAGADANHGSLDPDLKNISIGDLINLASGEMQHISLSDDANMESLGSSSMNVHQSNRSLSNIGLFNNPNQLFEHHALMNTSFHVTLRYRRMVVYDKTCINPSGCIISYGHPTHFQNNVYAGEMLGLTGCEQIHLPDCTTQNQEQQRLTHKLLSCTDQGLIIKVVDGNIVALRKCRCAIFVSSPTLQNGQTTKLVREQEMVIFDINVFKVALEQSLRQLGPKPSTSVTLGFGQRFDHMSDSLNDVLISATVVHLAASNISNTVYNSSPVSTTQDTPSCYGYNRNSQYGHYPSQPAYSDVNMSYTTMHA